MSKYGYKTQRGAEPLHEVLNEVRGSDTRPHRNMFGGLVDPKTGCTITQIKDSKERAMARLRAQQAEDKDEGFDMEKVKRGDAKLFQTVFTNQNHTADRGRDTASFITNVNKAAQKQPKVDAAGAKYLNDVLKQQKTVFPLPTRVEGHPRSTVGG